MGPRRFSREEVNAILAKALEAHEKSSDEFGEEELEAIAKEAGISPDALAAAKTAVETEKADQALLSNLRRSALRGFVVHASVFSLVNLMLAIPCLLLGWPFWFAWFTIPWGCVLLLQAKGAFFPSQARLQKGLAAAKEKARRHERRKRRKQTRSALEESALHFGEALEQSAAHWLSRAAEELRDDLARSLRSRRPHPRVRVDEADDGVRPAPKPRQPSATPLDMEESEGPPNAGEEGPSYDSRRRRS